MTTRPESSYIHGAGEAEAARLATLNRLLNAACLREVAPAPGDRILDVGAGQGQLTRDLARAAGRPAVGVERDPGQLAVAARLAAEAGEAGLLELRPGDALTLPLADAEWGTFDLAHARFILEHVPAPERVVAQMVQAVRPGGRVVLCDDDHALLRLHPEPPGLMRVWDAFVESYRRLGNDPLVGRRLVELLHGAGASPRRATFVFFGACAGDPAFPGFAANLAGNLRGARAAILGTGLVDEPALDAALAAFDAFAARPDAAIWYAMPWAEGVRR
jgi:SAM-dependent methyltransferase